MKKILTTSSALLATLALTSVAITTAHAQDAVYTSKASVSLEPNTDITPPVDPENPGETVEPETPGGGKPGVGTPGPLSLDFASSFAFGKQMISSSDVTYYAHPQRLSDGTVRQNYAQVTDGRGTFAGWTLSVKKDAQFRLSNVDPSVTAEAVAGLGEYLSGAELSINKGRVNGTVANAKPSIVNENPFVIGNADTVILSAKENQGMGTWVYAMGAPADYDMNVKGENDVAEKSPIALSVPGATAKKAGSYTTNLIWTLSDVPGN